MQRADSLEKDPDAGKDRRQEEKGTTEDEMVDGITNSTDMSLSKLWWMVKERETWRAAVHEVAKEADTSATEQQCFQIRHLSPYPILQKIQGQLYLYFFSSSTAATLAKCSKPVYSLQLLTSSDI